MTGRRTAVTVAMQPGSGEALADDARRAGGGSVVRAMLLVAVAATGVHQLTALAARSEDLDRAALSFVVGWVLSVALASSPGRGGVYSPAAAYLAVFGLFHGGLLLSYLLRGEAGLPGVEIGWFLGPTAATAATLASLGMITFAIASHVVTAGATRRPVRQPTAVESRILGSIGLGVQAVGVAIFSSVILRGGGLGLLRSGYPAYLQAAQGDSLLPYGLLALGVGPVLALAAGGRARTLAWKVFAAYALVAFPIGLRGEVLFPLVAMLVVQVRRGHRIRVLWTLVGTLLVMTLIGIVRQTRADGIGAVLGVSSLASPLDAVAEMGFSLRPTVIVLGWHDRGEAFRFGETVLAVPIRAIERILGRNPPLFDDRLFNVEILARVGPIGGSPVAEAYHNFGTVGVIVFMALLGVLVGMLDRVDRTPWNDALLGGMLVVLLIEVRNSFAPVPLQIALVLGLLGVVRLLIRKRTGSPSSPLGTPA